MNAVKPLRLLLVGDQELFRAGLVRLLREDQRVLIAGEAGHPLDAIRQVKALSPDVVMLDLAAPDADVPATTVALLAAAGALKVIVLASSRAPADALAALQAGASGYVLKDCPPGAIVATALAVMTGQTVITDWVAAALLTTATAEALPDGLTVREAEILKLVATGHSNKQIALRLKISDKTVRNHVSRSYRKLDISDRAQVVLYAVRKGLVTL